MNLVRNTNVATDDKMQIKDNPADVTVAQEALRMIAETRQSPLLLTFIETGTVYDTPPMTLNNAFEKFQVTDQGLDDEVLIEVFSVRVMDAPSQLKDLRQALRIIGEHRNSSKILEFLNTGRPNEAPEVARGQGEPVGLENIGNTCYLNSLLQFYFTIKPLRNMILNFDQYQEDELTDEIVERKRVGGRKVSKEEVERAKKCMCITSSFPSQSNELDSCHSPANALPRNDCIRINRRDA